MKRFHWVCLVLVALFCACDSDDDERKQLASLCTDATNTLHDRAQEADPETFKLMVQNALEACSGACDLDDSPSCSELQGHLEKMCGSMPGACGALCDSVKSPSLKEHSCAIAERTAID